MYKVEPRSEEKKPSVFFIWRGKNDTNDVLRETFLLKWLLFRLEEDFLDALSRRVRQALPTFGSSRAQTPSSPTNSYTRRSWRWTYFLHFVIEYFIFCTFTLH